jgi:hypothetical protein
MNSSRKRAGDSTSPRQATAIAVRTNPDELEACETQRGARSHGTTVRQAIPHSEPTIALTTISPGRWCGTCGSASMTSTAKAPAR